MMSCVFIINHISLCSYYGGNDDCEYGDASVIHMLTGWIPQHIPIKVENKEHLWEVLMENLPLWVREEEEESKIEEEEEEGSEGESGEDNQTDTKKKGRIVVANLTPRNGFSSSVSMTGSLNVSLCGDDQ